MYNDDSIRFEKFMNSYKEFISSKYQVFENIRHNFLKKKRLFLFLFIMAMVLSVALNIAALMFKIKSSAYGFIYGMEVGILFLIFARYSIITDKNYRKEMKKNLLQPILKNVFNIETGSSIPIEYVNSISYTNNKKDNPKFEIEKKIRDDSFHGEYSGIKFQAEEAGLHFYDGNNQSKPISFLLLFFELNKPLDNKSEINTKISSFYKHPEMIFRIAFILIIFAMLILWSNWMFIIEDNTFLTNFTSAFANWFLNWYSHWHLILKIGFPIFFMLFSVIFSKPFAHFKKCKLKKTQFETKDRQIKPKFLNLLNELNYVYSAYSVRCRLFNNKLTIAVETKKDLFEIGNIKTPIDKSQSIQTFYQELNIIFKIIDFLVENNEDITA